MAETKLQDGTSISPTPAIPAIDGKESMPGVRSVLSSAALPALTPSSSVDEPKVNPTSGRDTLRTWGNNGYIHFHTSESAGFTRFGTFGRDNPWDGYGPSRDRPAPLQPTNAQSAVRNEIVTALGLPLGSVNAFNLDTDPTLAGDKSAISRGADGKEYVQGGLSVETMDGAKTYIHFKVPYPATPGGTVEIDGKSLAAKDVPDFVEEVAEFDRSTYTNSSSLRGQEGWSDERWVSDHLADASASLTRSEAAPSPRARDRQILDSINELSYAVDSFQKLEPEVREKYAPELERLTNEAITKGKQIVENAAFSEFSDAHTAFFGMKHIREGLALQSSGSSELVPAARHLAELQLERAEYETTRALTQKKPTTDAASFMRSSPDPFRYISGAEYFVKNYGLTDLQPQIDALDTRLQTKAAAGREL